MIAKKEMATLTIGRDTMCEMAELWLNRRLKMEHKVKVGCVYWGNDNSELIIEFTNGDGLKVEQ